MAPSRPITAEMLENAQRRYEATDEPVGAIAKDCGICKATFFNWVKRYGWCKRTERPARGVPAELRLNLDADRALAEAEAGTEAGAKTAPPDGDPAGAPDILAIAGRLERQLEQQLAQVEHLRALPWPQAQRPDAESMTRTLERLTDALLKVRRLRAFTEPAGSDVFDMPRDIDEFRRALARRIRAFVRSRTGGGVSGAGDGSGAGRA